jgi:hypothetical protein
MVFNATFNNISVTLYIAAVSFIGGGKVNAGTKKTRQFDSLQWDVYLDGLYIHFRKWYREIGVIIQHFYTQYIQR